MPAIGLGSPGDAGGGLTSLTMKLRDSEALLLCASVTCSVAVFTPDVW